MQHLVVGVQNNHAAGSQSGQRAVGQLNAIVLQKIAAAHGGQHVDALQSLGAAEARLRKGQVGRDAQHFGVVHLFGQLIEAELGCSAHIGVYDRENIENFATIV